MEPKLIKKVRQQNQWTQDKFAEYLGVSKRTIKRWENGQSKPKGEVSEKLAVLLSSTQGDTSEGDIPKGDTSEGDTSRKGDTSEGDIPKGDTSEGDTSRKGDTSEGDNQEPSPPRDVDDTPSSDASSPTEQDASHPPNENPKRKTFKRRSPKLYEEA